MFKKVLFGLLAVSMLMLGNASYAAKPIYNGVSFYWSWESNTQATPSMGKFTHTSNGSGGSIDTLNVSKWDFANSSQSLHDSFLDSLTDGGNETGYVVISDPTSATGYQVYRVSEITEHTNHYSFKVNWIEGGATWWSVPLNRTIQIAFYGFSNASNVPQAGAVKLWSTNGFRLSLANNDPSYPYDIASASTVYMTPYTSDAIALYSGASWGIYNAPQKSLALSGLTTGKNYDVFVYLNAGTPTLEIGPAWTNDTDRATNIVRLNGVWVKSGAPTRRYLGSIRATGATTTTNTEARRWVFNVDNPLPTSMSQWTYDPHTYSSLTLRKWNNDEADSTQTVLIGVGNERMLTGSGGTYGSAGAGGDGRIAVIIEIDPANYTVGTPEISLPPSTTPNWCFVDPPFTRMRQGLNYVRIVQRVIVGTSNYAYSYHNFLIDL